jgi:hypothetical protein
MSATLKNAALGNSKSIIGRIAKYIALSAKCYTLKQPSRFVIYLSSIVGSAPKY